MGARLGYMWFLPDAVPRMLVVLPFTVVMLMQRAPPGQAAQAAESASAC